MAVSSTGEKYFLIKKGSINRIDFSTFIDSMQLDNNTCIVMDNASIHKNLKLNTNPYICYNVPYFPQNNPIELCFGKIKNYFRQNNNLSIVNITNLINLSIEQLTSDLCENTWICL